jgi:Flp pilus assembly protein TadG
MGKAMFKATASDFFLNRSGATMVVFGLSLSVLGVAIGAAVEYASLASRRATLQVAADSAALAAATELSLANTSDQRIDSVAKSVALAKLYEHGHASHSEQAKIASQVVNERTGVRVSISENVVSVMGRLLNRASTDLQAQAVARAAGQTRLCLLGLDTHRSSVVHLEKDARITASGCAIYSNSKHPKGMEGGDNATATASLICSAGGFSGKRVQFTPSPTTDCPIIADPLQSQAAPEVGSCGPTNTDKKIEGGIVSLPPGTYCGLTVKKGAQVSLQNDGIYVIKDGPLLVENNSALTGTNVSFYFTGDKAGLRFDSGTTISLTAPRSGSLAGILLFDDRNVGNPVIPPLGLNSVVPSLPPGVKLREYRIISDNARTLLGTIYLPGGRLVIDSKKPVADRSAYTVIVAGRVELYEGPNLYLNTNYASTDIPLPKGVGPQSGGRVSLVQ